MGDKEMGVEVNLVGMIEKFYLGIDGGGTKTELVLADSQGEIIRQLFAQGCNPMDVGIEKTKKILREAISELCIGIPYSGISVFAGIAGGNSGRMKEEITQFLGEMGFCEFDNDSDSLNIIAAGLGDKDGVAVIMGTGICAFARAEGKLSRVAGWGYFFDNGGSAYNLGRDAISAYYCALDGSGVATALTDKIKRWADENLALDTDEMETGRLLLGKLYTGGKKLIAGFAPMVFEAAEEGDIVAKEIVDRNMEEAAHIIETARKKLGEKNEQKAVPVVIAGGLTKQERLLEFLSEKLEEPEKCKLSILGCAPVMGAVNLARNLVLK